MTCNYLYQGDIYTFATPLREDNYLISTDEALQDTHYVSITAERAAEIEEERNRQIEPITPVEPQYTNEELRKQAYEREADQYLIAYQGYMLEGNEEKSEEQKQLYLAKKEEIRMMYPIDEGTE